MVATLTFLVIRIYLSLKGSRHYPPYSINARKLDLPSQS